MYGERMERLEVGHPFRTAAGGKLQRALQHDPTSLMVFGTTCFPLGGNLFPSRDHQLA